MLLTPHQDETHRIAAAASLKDQQPLSQHISPKRKRTDSLTTPKPSALNLDLTATYPSTEETSGCESPRSKVAARLQALDIRQQPVARSQSPRKRIKREPAPGSPQPVSVIEIPETPWGAPSPAVIIRRNEKSFLADEKNQVDGNNIPLPPSPLAERLQPEAKPKVCFVVTAPSSEEGPSKGPLRSPPPPTIEASSESSEQEKTSEPRSESSQDSPVSSLTWQESEITGHELDPAFPDDDGEGINGIGFKPTPGMAHARSQRRKQQVNEWRAREAREARQRRYQKRQGWEAAQASKGGDPGRRVVRFA